MPGSRSSSLSTIRVAQSQRKAHTSPLACKKTSAAKASRTIAGAKARRAQTLHGPGGATNAKASHKTASTGANTTSAKGKAGRQTITQAKKTAARKTACNPRSVHSRTAKATAAKTVGGTMVIGLPSGRP